MSLAKMKCGLFLCIFVLVSVQSTAQQTSCTHNIDQKEGSLYWWSFICSNVTIETLRELSKHPKPDTNIDNDFFKITIENTELDRLDKELFSNDKTQTWKILSLAIFNSSLKTVSADAFNPPGAWKFNEMDKLNLSNNEIISFEANNLEVLKQLRILSVAYNKIESLNSSTFSNLQRLVHLDISYNYLEIINAYTFKELSSLEILNLTGNKLFYLHCKTFFGLNSLQHLMLTGNYIQNIARGTLQKLPSLKNLQLDLNSLSDLKIGTFSNLNKLQFLNLSYNSFLKVNEMVLFPLQSLVFLDLNNNHLTTVNYFSLILHLPKLKDINVNNNDWMCSFLTEMLGTFRDRGINYLFNSNRNYTQGNVYGITCQDDDTQCI